MRKLCTTNFLVAFTAASIFSLTMTSPATAMAPAANADEDHNIIIVTGEKQRKKKINNFIKSAINISESQYARFSAPVCPTAMGLNAEYNKVIVDRMRAVTKAAGVRTASDDCDPNMAIVAIKDPKDFVSLLRNKHPSAFGKMSIPDRDKIISGPGPTYAWNTTYSVGAGGARNSAAGGTGSGSSAVDGFGSDGGAQTYSSSNSRINTSIEKDISMSILVIEKSALLGVNLRQVADYGVMRLLANTDEPEQTNVSERSVLTLFSDRAEGYEAPQSVTAWDLALLKSLYSTKNNVSAALQRSAMTNIFEAELLKIAEAAEAAEDAASNN